MKKAELIFIPFPAAGHVYSMVEMAKILVDRDDLLSITVLLMKHPRRNISVSSFANTNVPRLKFIDLPNDDTLSELLKKPPVVALAEFIEIQKTHVREIVAGVGAASSSGSSRLAGIVLDVICSPMIDVADEFGIPTYVFFTCNASYLGLLFHVQTRADEHLEDFSTLYKNSVAELFVRSFENPVPVSAIPLDLLEGGDGYEMLLQLARCLRKTKGIIINTFMELEPHALRSLSLGKNPTIYPAGPVLNLNSNNNNDNNSRDQYDNIMSWLDSQPSSSVVFLCFGSMGSFDDKQVKEIAYALENSGHRFLWSLRKRPTTGQIKFPIEITDFEEVLPKGFLERTQGVGKVIGWAPQAAVLSHPAVCGFVSHCGWNSTLESVWFGVPMATWPLYSEQQLNAFLFVKELKMAVDIKMDFRGDFKGDIKSIVSAKEIEVGIQQLMMTDDKNGIRNKVKDMKEKSRAAIGKGGSSYTALECLIGDIFSNIA